MREDIKKIYLDNRDLIGSMGITNIYGEIVDDDEDEERRFYVYEWFTKDENKIFYVGKGTGTRYNHIISDMKRPVKGLRYEELQKNFGIDYRIVMDELTDTESQIFEVYWIYTRAKEGEVLLQYEHMYHTTDMKKHQELCEVLKNRNFEPKIEISDYRKRYFNVRGEYNFDSVEIDYLLKTHFLYSDWRAEPYITEEKNKITEYVEKWHGRVFSTLAKDVKSVIEFGAIDFDKYCNLKEKGLKIIHSLNVLNFIESNPNPDISNISLPIPKIKSISMEFDAELLKYDLSKIYEEIDNSYSMEETIKELNSKEKYSRKIEDDSNVVDYHFVYLGLCESVYKRRHEDEKYFEITKQVCIRDLSLIEKEKLYSDRLEGCVFPTLPRLINIYINNEEYAKALEISKFAIKNNLRDETVDGYKKRYQKILKKMS
jgi:hypothetical protein